jgi:hypothetical protein
VATCRQDSSSSSSSSSGCSAASSLRSRWCEGRARAAGRAQCGQSAVSAPTWCWTMMRRDTPRERTSCGQRKMLDRAGQRAPFAHASLPCACAGCGCLSSQKARVAWRCLRVRALRSAHTNMLGKVYLGCRGVQLVGVCPVCALLHVRWF